MKRLQAKLYGRVQGVGFRMYVLEQAHNLAITGTVRNIYFPRRYVEVIAEGDEETLQELLTRLKVGPPMASVQDINPTWMAPTGEFANFRII